MSSTYEAGTRCWVQDDKEGWIGAEVKAKNVDGSKVEIELDLENGETVKIETTTDSIEKGDESNSTLPPLRNPPVLEATEDLTTLSYLNEPAILHAIKARYAQSNIYTYSGIVLIAANPFQRMDNLYTPDIIQAYADRKRGELEPHLFAIAEDAYRCMIRDQKNQTIIVSGESGAGKTVSAKYIMRYFATVEVPDQNSSISYNDSNAHSSHTEKLSKTEEQILATNPIMEAFGNAKTTRNDNSSRFGKYLEIIFNKDVDIIGAKIRTYLLERSRLVFQPAIERNYHIFYQLCAGATEEEREAFNLLPVSEYNYLNQGGDPVIEGVNDADEFNGTKKALTVIGINDVVQRNIFELLSALLLIGNIEIEATRNDASLSSDEPSLAKACKLLKIDPVLFAKWTIKKQITTRSEKIVSSLSKQQANVVRDSVAKYIYASLFDWLVMSINKGLCPAEVEEHMNSFIGVLDIYGFEHFKRNSFEQFCINYANEKLQQEFTSHVFKLEQDEYVQEEIKWDFIDFADNQPCISLIEAKLGILSLLDEEARLPAGSDDSWINKLYQNFDNDANKQFFKKPRFGKTSFIISHYAMDVAYEMDAFVEKNRDTVPEEHLENLMNSENQFLKIVIESALETAQAAAPPPSASKSRTITKKPTLGSIFKGSLIELMSTINSTNVHYIRCIKPNEEKEAWKFDSPMVLGQLRACGVLETIRISCAGFPTRWTYGEFASRYFMLIRSKEWTNDDDIKSICDKILGSSIDDADKYQLGKTKIFFRAGMLAHLEKLRTERLNECAIIIQKNVRKTIQQTKYLKIRQSIVAVQALIRAHLARAKIEDIKRSQAATIIQTNWRGYVARRDYNRIKQNILSLQSVIRGALIRKSIHEKRTNDAVLLIQRNWKGYIARKEYKSHLGKIILGQNCIRRFLAKKELQKLKVEAKSVDRYKEVQYKLENKVVQLTQTLTEKNQQNKKLLADIESYEAKIIQWQAKHKVLEDGHKELEGQLGSISDDHSKQLNSVELELAKVREEHSATLESFSLITEENSKLKADLEAKISELENTQSTIKSQEGSNQTLTVRINQLESQLDKLINNSSSISTSVFNGSPTKTGIRGTLGDSIAANPVTPKSESARGVKHRSFNEPVYLGSVTDTSPLHQQRSIHNDPTSSAAFTSIFGINGEMERLLEDDKFLTKEVIKSLIIDLEIPKFNSSEELHEKEVLFPAHIINLVTSEMWRLGFVKESEKFLGEVMQAIQNKVISYHGNDIINPGSFWISNVHEMLSFVVLAETNMVHNEVLLSEMGAFEFEQYGRLLALVKLDLENLEFNIYHTLMKELKKLLDKVIVPAVITTQSLPGFITSENTRFLTKMFNRESQAYTMDDVLSVFNKVHKAMTAYHLEPDFIRQPILELLKLVGVKAFNDLIMRRNFLSWKRGLQINYNITRIEEWCKVHNIAEGIIRLEHLMESAKLLQLKKATLEDIEIIYDICWILSPIQIQKLLQQYLVADYEDPINAEILEAVAQKVRNDKSNSPILLEATAMDDSGPFELIDTRVLTRLETFIPDEIKVPKIRKFVELSTLANSEGLDEEGMEEQFEQTENMFDTEEQMMANNFENSTYLNGEGEGAEAVEEEIIDGW
ncbi:hypothetical protein NADFUDRAFT_52130 [Nadsonia fulvescens var. elongata DSM 6958]|uniref:Myosin-2 n=1 Tax=Nadsonia fulvescens var. elongata DSM 6958 TaxID=857566 RepID=A0A1E3PHR9_9ASCO|nr:hypothetical protein NADFUDRAFT_52130 [Nadsonia fulvescens var. elongata DSM 6958]